MYIYVYIYIYTYIYIYGRHAPHHMFEGASLVHLRGHAVHFGGIFLRAGSSVSV